MPNEKLLLLACFESAPNAGDLCPFYRLWGGMTDGDYARYLRAQYAYEANRVEPLDTHAIVDFLIAKDEPMILAGGIAAIKGDFQLLPGCCCGIETWREWHAIQQGGATPEMGHDPAPWVDTSSEICVLHNGLANTLESIEVTYDEIHQALTKTQTDLSQFLKGLGEWLTKKGIANSGLLTAKIDEDYQISREFTQPADGLAFCVS